MGKVVKTLLFVLVVFLSNALVLAVDDDILAKEMATPNNLIKTQTKGSFDESIANGQDGKWVVFYGSPWCPHCQHFAPIFKEFALKASEKFDLLHFGHVNCELENETCESQKVTMYPTIFMYSQGYKYPLNKERDMSGMLAFVEEFDVNNKKYPIRAAKKDNGKNSVINQSENGDENEDTDNRKRLSEKIRLMKTNNNGSFILIMIASGLVIWTFYIICVPIIKYCLKQEEGFSNSDNKQNNVYSDPEMKNTKIDGVHLKKFD